MSDVPVDENQMPVFLQPYEVTDSQRTQDECSHVNSETFYEDTGDSRRHVENYKVFVCHDCGLQTEDLVERMVT